MAQKQSPIKYRPKPHLLRLPVPHLLSSNRTVSDGEYDLIRVAMDRVHAEIDLLKELECIEGDNNVAYRQRLACEDFLAKHEPLLHWTRRLLPELLVHIFIYCTDGNTSIPWNISQVCRKWRSIALSTPQLWRKIPPGYIPRDVPTERRFLEFLSKDYLKRSRNEAIIFSWHSEHALSAQLFTALAQHAERWGDVHLAIYQRGSSTWLNTRLANLEGRLRSLYSLKLVLSGSRLLLPLNAFKSAPQLRFLLIDASLLVSSDPPLQLDWPWNQVTHFSGTYQWMDTFDHLSLSKFTNLVYIRLENCIMYNSPITAGAVTLPACKFLHLELYKAPFPHPTVTTNLLKSIHCPRLERFRITYYIIAAYDDIFAQVAAFVQRHASHLTSLHWEYDAPVPSHPLVVMNYDTKPSLAMMESLQQLKVLRVSEAFCNALESFLTLLIENPHFLPSLQKLDMKSNPYARVDDVVDFCRTLKIFVHNLEEKPDNRVVHQKIQEIRLEIPTTGNTLGSRFCMTPWEIVMELEGWAQDLQDGWEKQVKLEQELKKVKDWTAVLQGALDDRSEVSAGRIEKTLLALEKHEMTDALVLHVSVGGEGR